MKGHVRFDQPEGVAGLRAVWSCPAARLANLEILLRENLVENAATVGAYWQERLRTVLLDHPLVGDVRGIGLLAGVELADKSAGEPRPFEPRGAMGKRFAAACYKNGLIGRLLMDSDILALAPPLIVTRNDTDSCHHPQAVLRRGRPGAITSGRLYVPKRSSGTRPLPATE